ncbi:MAG: hypothetical protein AB2L12_05505 [Smithellaceae bacterium]
MKKIIYITVFFLTIIGFTTTVTAKTGFVDVPVNSAVQTRTITGIGLPPAYGPPEHFYTVLRIYPLVPGKRYEATLTYDAGTDMGYAYNWQDGDPTTKDSVSFVGIGSGTGSRELKNKEERFLFTVDPKSTSNVLYVIVRSYKVWDIRFAVTDKLSGVTRDSQDRWGYYYVTDFDFSKTSPFLLTRGGYIAPATSAGVSSFAQAKIAGPLPFNAGQFSGTMKYARLSENEGIVWLKINGSNVEEIVNAVFHSNGIKFVRTMDCRFNVVRPYAQIYTGLISSDGSISGNYFNDYEAVLIYPWEARNR